jgi:hypothetical protein
MHILIIVSFYMSEILSSLFNIYKFLILEDLMIREGYLHRKTVPWFVHHSHSHTIFFSCSIYIASHSIYPGLKSHLETRGFLQIVQENPKIKT